MTITTKAALADELGVTRARVSQYVKAGLPVREDGKLNRDDALNWLRLNQTGLNYQDRGATRAMRLAKQAVKRTPAAPVQALATPAEPIVTAEDDAARLALAWSYRLHAKIIAASVLEAGGTIEVAYAAASIAHSTTVTNLCLVLRYLGHPDFQGDEEDIGLRDIGRAEPDWLDLARRDGTTFSREKCEAYLSGLPIERPDAEPPHRFETEFTLADLTAGTPYGA